MHSFRGDATRMIRAGQTVGDRADGGIFCAFHRPAGPRRLKELWPGLAAFVVRIGSWLTSGPTVTSGASGRSSAARRLAGARPRAAASSSVSSAASRSLVGFSSIDRSDSPVKAGGESSEPRVLDLGAGDVCVRGELIGASGEASGVISRGRFRFWAIDWVTRLVSARGRPGSAGLDAPALAPGPRHAQPRRPEPARSFTAPEAGRGRAAVGPPDRESDSRITIPSSAFRPRGGAGRVGRRSRQSSEPEPCRSTADAGRRSGSPAARADSIEPARAHGIRPVAVRPDPGPRAGRAGNGCASRLNSEVSAQSAMIDSKTMNLKHGPVPAISVLFYGQRRPTAHAHEGTGTFSRRALPVPAIALRISVSAWTFRRL